MNFEAYLISKKIDSAAFQQAEPDIWKNWNFEFDQVHPNSFTAQKLYLINPIRRRFPLKLDAVKPVTQELVSEAPKSSVAENVSVNPVSVNPKPVVPRPVFKPKPKTN